MQEIVVSYSGAGRPVAIIVDNNGDIWNGTAFVSISDPPFIIEFVETGPVWYANFPTAILAGDYAASISESLILVPDQADLTYIETQLIGWNGLTVAPSVDDLSLTSIALADIYFNNRLFTESWFTITVDNKQRALNFATQIIDTFNFIGSKTSESQDHEWPRKLILINGIAVDETTIPSAILFAQYEIAYALVRGIDPERESRNLRITSRGYSSVRTTYDPRNIPEHLKYGVPSALAWSYLSTYLNWGASGGIKLHRVS